MEDSFFGFDASIPLDEDSGGGRIAEPSEEEYDALNDETFGSAINGDWEEAHESLVKLTDNFNADTMDEFGNKLLFSPDASSGPSTPALTNLRIRRADSDLELNLSSMKLDDVEFCFDEGDSIPGGDLRSGINMDPSVWASHPLKPNTPANIEMRPNNSFFPATRNGHMGFQSADLLHEHLSDPFRQEQHHQHYGYAELNHGLNSPYRYLQLPHSVNAPKICTLEDIERNLIVQQTIQNEEQNNPPTIQQQKQSHGLRNILQETMKASGSALPQTQHDQHNQKQLLQIYPPSFSGSQPARSSNNFVNNLVQHPLGNFFQQQQATNMMGNRMPPGFPVVPLGVSQGHPHLPPHPLLNQNMLSNFPHQHPRPLPNPHLPIALNNLQMHPNFNAMRAAAVVAGLHPVSLVSPPHQPTRLSAQHIPNPALMNNQHSTNSMYNMFSMRLVQEIQQNHPLLQNNARQQHISASQINTPLYQQQRLTNLKQSHRRDGAMGNGNLPPEEFDEYANLMSTRDKHWLIGIQLSQLNTDTPYIDDYYYTVYRERKAAVHGNMSHSQAHKDNQLNHPLTQPKGHAQLILVQLGNKNGTRNGQHRDREHRNSETSGISNLNGAHEQKSSYVFTPLKFENSLGKLQFGSVTAPRKIIDAEIMGGEQSATAGGKACKTACKIYSLGVVNNAVTLFPEPPPGIIGDASSNTQRKSRHILLHIETLFRIVLKLEDLDNPNAIATIITKKRKEIERIAALEQLENANRSPEEGAVESSNPQSMNPALKNKFAYEIETKEALINKLMQGLPYEKIIALMNVRKGKILLRRIMPYIEENDIRWNVWIGVFASLQNVIKKDREDAEGILYALYPEFKKHIREATFTTLVRVSDSILINDKTLSGVFCSKFGISSLVCLILQAEHIYMIKSDNTLDEDHMKKWRNFLNEVARALNHTIQNQTICAAIETDSIQPMTIHFARFKDLKLDSLLALITEAKQQIN